MSQHENVSCDACLKSDFRGKRYKCLTCPNYDLCSNCYESGVRSTRHTPDHPMQCILTRSDYDIFYGGETFNTDQPYSLTCPFCGRMGFTEITLHEHVVADHSEGPQEVICPICASLPDCEPNHVTDDFATHLALEHRNLREWDEPQTTMRGRRAPHPTRGVSSNRPRRSQFSTAPGLSSFTTSTRDSMDPIAELLSQLSGVRRAANLSQSHSNQIQQLQMQLQLERNSGVGNGGGITSGLVSGSGSGSGSSSGININSNGLTSGNIGQRQSSRSNMARRHQQSSSSTSGSTQSSSNNYAYKALVNGSGHQSQHQQPLSSYLVAWEPSSSSPGVSTIGNGTTNQPHHYGTSSSSFGNNLLTASSAATSSTSTSTIAPTSQNLVNTCTQPVLSENEQEALEIERAERSLFVQELLLNTLIEESGINSDSNRREDDSMENQIGSNDYISLVSKLKSLLSFDPGNF